MKYLRKDKFKNSTRVYFSDFSMSWNSYLTFLLYFARESNFSWKLNRLIYKAASKLRIPPSQITEEHLCNYTITAINRSCGIKSSNEGII